MAGQGTDPVLLAFQLALAGRYSIDRELGRGGMGIVYLARDVDLDRPVAIKLLPPDKAAQPALRHRFLGEARLAAKLSHPNIVPIHAVDEAGEFVFYVMAYVDGETLASRVRTRGPFSGAEAARLLREVAWALGHAHAHGLVHRDVKPDNILLEAGTGRALVADFGIAAAAGHTDEVAGTPEFMSPEQALGGDVDARSDLYGLGVTAFYLLSGRLPFEGSSATEVLAKHVTEPPPPVGAPGLTVPRELASLVDRCLAKEPGDRPASADAFAEQLSVAIDRRREIPAALRAFVKRRGRLASPALVVIPLALAVPTFLIAQAAGSAVGLATFAIGWTAGMYLSLVAAARELAASGFSDADLLPAFADEIERMREEHGAEGLRGPSVLERALRSISRVAGAVMALTAVPVVGMTWLASKHGPAIPGLIAAYLPLFRAFTVATLIAIPGSVSSLALLQQRRDVDTSFWKRFWTGRAGRFAFALAKKLTGPRSTVSPMTHRATELSLGLAAEQLYESLPKAARGTLRDLPSLLRRLQGDAQALRTLHDGLQEVLAVAGDAGSSAQYAGVRADRDAVRGKLREAVGALETIRLNLLRLHAGSATVEGLTTHLGVAAEVSAGIERLIAAHEEVERGLEYPRELSTTPV